VFPQQSNFLAFTISGAYTVDWGDGVTENVASGVKAQHEYSYTDPDLNATVTSDGYKMAVVVITPQAGQNITSVDFNQKYAQAGSTFPDSSPILEIILSCPNLTGLTLGNAISSLAFCKNLVNFNGVNMGLLTDLSNSFANLVSLKNVSFNDLTNITNMSSMFSSCTSLTTVPLFNTAAVTNMSSMFSGCTSLTSVPLLISGAGTTTTKFNTIFSSCISLTRAALNGSEYSISYTGCKLSKEELESIFNYLDTIGAASQTITVTNNWGAPTPVTLTGTTTVGSTTISMANTTGIDVGMQITGTGSPLTSTRAVTFTDAGDLVNLASHGLSNGDEVSFATIVTTTGIVTNRIYYVVNAAAGTFQVAATLGGPALALTTNGSGTLRYRTEVVSINPNVSITVSRQMAAGGANSLTFRQLRTGTALLKGWAVTA
jgi:surface protein